MKTIFISDIHGRDTWKGILNSHYVKGDRVVFLGDYLDSFDITVNTQLTNLLDIIEFKKTNSNIILLWGNHDVQYRLPLNAVNDKICAGYNGATHVQAYHIFKEYDRLFQWAYQIDNVLITHAGVTRYWLEWAEKEVSKITDITNIVDILNILGETENPLMFKVSKYSGGRGLVASPLWARPQEFDGNNIELIQVVGHTWTEETRFENNVWFTDTGNKDVLILENNKFKIK